MGYRTSKFPERKPSVRKQPESGRNRYTLERMGLGGFGDRNPAETELSKIRIVS